MLGEPLGKVMDKTNLVEILLPTRRNDGTPLGAELFARVETELTERFGGLTAYYQSPASGYWTNEANRTQKDDIVVFEVMISVLEVDWWRDYRRLLEERFEQEVIVIRSTYIVTL